MDEAQIDRLAARLSKLDEGARRNLLKNLRAAIPPPRLSKYCPKTISPKQDACLSSQNLEVLFGGAAGPGKTALLTIAALQYADMPNYSALLLRTTMAELEMRGSLIDLSKRWLANTDAQWQEQKKRWFFPKTNGIIKFGYLERDDQKWQYGSAQFHFIGLDEAAQFKNEDTYKFMFSRLRKDANDPIPLRMRLASNPIGPGAAWLKKRFITSPESDNLRDEPCFLCDHLHWTEKCPNPQCECPLNPNSIPRLYVPAKLKDNPYIDVATYRRSLAQLDPYTRQALEDGDWDAKPPGRMFQRAWFPTVDRRPADPLCRVRFWDLAATQEDKKKNPSWTCGVRMSYTEEGIFTVEHVVRVRETPGNVKALVKQTAAADPPGTAIYIEEEPGSSGKFVTAEYIKYLPNYAVKGYPVRGDKAVRASPYAAQAESGNVRLVKAEWNEVYLDEHTQFPSTTVKNDQVDGSSGAYMVLAEQVAGAGDFWTAGERRSHDW